MPSRLGVVALLSLFALSACASVSRIDRIPLTPFGEIARNPGIFDGKLVRVGGYVIRAPERRDLWESRPDSNSSDASKACMTLLGLRRVVGERGFFEGDIVVTGIFRADAVPDNVVDLAACSDIGIEVASIEWSGPSRVVK